MNKGTPSPQTTLVILLGASEWPYSPDFHSSESFANSAKSLKDYFLDAFELGLPKENLLDLFNSNHSSDDIDKEIGDFLEKRILEMRKARRDARDVLVYFVGHGGFCGNDLDYYLAIRRTRTANPAASGMRIATLAHTLKERARHLRRIIILDCCFAASATRFFQNLEPTQAAIAQTFEAFKVQEKGVGFPMKGTSLLCSSRHNIPSLIAPNGQYTMFSQALLRVLRAEGLSQEANFTLRTIARLAEDFLHSIYREAPRPEVHSPDQSEGDVADVPFFPNPSLKNNQGQVPSILEFIDLLPSNQLALILGVDPEGKTIQNTLLEVGHMLLAGGRMGKTNHARSICLQLCAKNSPENLRIAILDLASQEEEWKEFSSLFPHIALTAFNKDEVEQNILKFEEELERRKKQLSPNDPTWLIVIEGFTALEPSKVETALKQNNPIWQAFMELLRYGKAARIFVLATTKRFLASGPIHDMFDLQGLYAPDPEDESVDALALKIASLDVPEYHPIIYLRIRRNPSITKPQCSICKKRLATQMSEDYINLDDQNSGLLIIDDEFEMQSWLKIVLEQVTHGPRLYRTTPLCLDCAIVLLDTYMNRKGSGRAIINETSLAQKSQQPLMSYVVFKQFRQPDIPIVCSTNLQTIEEIIEEIQEKGVLQLEKCQQCGSTLKDCAMCNQPKCFNCTDKFSASMGICRPCLNEYNASIQSHVRETIANPELAEQKQWCDTCNDWMPQLHKHKTPRRWL